MYLYKMISKPRLPKPVPINVRAKAVLLSGVSPWINDKNDKAMLKKGNHVKSVKKYLEFTYNLTYR